MEQLMLFALILLPLLCAGLFLILRGAASIARVPVLIGCCAAMAASAVYLCYGLLTTGTHFTVAAESLGELVGLAVTAVDVIVLAAILYFGIKLKNLLITLFSLLQAAGFAYMELFLHPHEPEIAFQMDYLSAVLLLLSSVVGSIVAIYAVGYMKAHEHHQHLQSSRQPRFFAVVFLFLGAMNALAITDNLLWLYTFWEITTLCSFLLISHDKTPIAIKNASRALWMNSLGGVAFVGALLLLSSAGLPLQISELVRVHGGAFHGFVEIATALICFAGFTKAAQFPFQKWLLGAMVAPTPVSALLHSSTMVKAGVYIIIRLSPMFGGTLIGTVISIIGAFTFMAASAIAISQTNGKKVLAYSTIANLGLVVACCGIGNNIAIAAAILLLIYHAISKGLLFMCVGMVELEIGSRNIENMQGMFKKMPFTTVIMVVGMISMLLPPFGVLATKWLAIESAVHSPFVLIMVILGSAFTIVFWVKWIGIILTMSHKEKRSFERLHPSVAFAFTTLLGLVFAASAGIFALFNLFVQKQVTEIGFGGGVGIVDKGFGLAISGSGLPFSIGEFTGVPMFFVLIGVFIMVLLVVEKINPERIKAPYVGGELANDDIRGIEFIGPMDKVENIEVHNYYMSGAFSEARLGLPATLISIVLIIVMFGVIQ